MPKIETALLPLCFVTLLAGCASNPPPAPVTYYECHIPPQILKPVTWPAPPAGEYTQADVAAYIETAVYPAFKANSQKLVDAGVYANGGKP